VNPEKTTGNLAAWISLVSNAVLTAGKIAVGLLFQSGVLIADGIHNAGDVIASATAFGSMRISSKPADEDHPYGHGKAEVIGAGAVAVILILAALYIGYHSLAALFLPPGEAHWIALAAAAVSLIWKQALYFYTMRVGRKLNSRGLIATAYDHLADVYASVAAVIGIGLALLGDYLDNRYLAYGDPVAGLIVAILVLKLAVHMGRDTVDVLMEKNVDPAKLDDYARLVLSVPGVKRIDRLRAREHGQYVLIDVRVSVPAELTVQDGHDIGKQIKQTIMHRYSNVDEVLVHLNPWYRPDKEEEVSSHSL
jgi:cation diffusion facilitator family transporter